MECSKVQQKLGAYLDGELSDKEHRDVQSHLAHCRACMQELARLKKLSGLAEKAAPSLPDEGYFRNLPQRIIGQLPVKPARASWWQSLFAFLKRPVFYRVAGAVVATAIVVMVSRVVLIQGTSTPEYRSGLSRITPFAAPGKKETENMARTPGFKKAPDMWKQKSDQIQIKKKSPPLPRERISAPSLGNRSKVISEPKSEVANRAGQTVQLYNLEEAEAPSVDAEQLAEKLPQRGQLSDMKLKESRFRSLGQMAPEPATLTAKAEALRRPDLADTLVALRAIATMASAVGDSAAEMPALFRKSIEKAQQNPLPSEKIARKEENLRQVADLYYRLVIEGKQEWLRPQAARFYLQRKSVLVALLGSKEYARRIQKLKNS